MYERSRNLLDCHIAGFTYYNGLDVIDQLKPGTPVKLKSEPENPHDPDAVAIYFEDAKLGYVPQAKNSIVSSLLYFGHDGILEAKINFHNPEANTENQFCMLEYIDSHLLFLHDKNVPTNNSLCERLLRVLKMKLRQVMTLRSDESLEYLCATLGVLAQIRSRGESLYDGVAAIFKQLD
jgi:hypothetical protein